MSDNQQALFLEGSIARALMTLAVPIILASILQAGYQLTDAFWVGRLGAASVAAVSVSFPVTFLVIAMGSGLAMAGATLTAQYMGAERPDMVNHVAAQTMLMVTVVSVILGSIGYYLSPYLLHLLKVAPDVHEGALGFMRVSFIGIIFVFIFSMFQSLMRGVGQITIPALGLSMAVSTLVGQNIGAGNIQRAAGIVMLGSLYGFVALTLVGIITYIFAHNIVAFFVPDDAEVIREGAKFIRIMALAWGGIGVQLCIVSTFGASGNMLSAMVIAMVSQWMIQFPLAYVLSKHTDLHETGLWWSFPVTNIAVAIIALCWFARGSWKHTRITEDDKHIAKVTQDAVIEDGLPG